MVVALIAVYIGVRRTRVEVRHLCEALSVPEKPHSVRGVWYWIEKAPEGAQLVQVKAEKKVVAAAKKIPAYWATPDALAWTEWDGALWHVYRSAADGSSRADLFQSRNVLDAVWTDGSRTAWLEALPLPKTAARALPPLGPRTDVWVHDGRAASRMATLAEGLSNAQLFGTREDVLYVAGRRAEGIRVSMAYAVKPGAAPERILSENGPIDVALDGERLIWTAPSVESNYMLTACLKAMDLKSGKTRVVADWLPAEGKLHRMRSGWALCAGLTETAWRVDEARRCGRPISTPTTVWAIAADDRGLIGVLRRKTKGNATIMRIQTP